MSSDLKIPHMGWNKTVNKDNPLFKNLQNPYLYFLYTLIMLLQMINIQ